MKTTPASSHASSPSVLPKDLVRWLWVLGGASVLFRAWLAWRLPMTGDEALFYWWARFLDYGYYDHPPMVAWSMAATRALLGDGALALRLPMLVLPLGVGAAMWWAWAPVDRVRAAWAVLLYWLMPVNWVNTLMTTDSPLILWAVWSVAALVRAERQAQAGQKAWGSYAASGVFIGLAFLSKYFAVLLGVGYLVYFAVWGRARLRGLLLLVLCGLPAAGVNLLWNLTHCWTNIMFNLFNRNEDAHFQWDQPLTYGLMMLYLLGPVLLWLGWRSRQSVWQAARQHPLAACSAMVPLLLFALMSGKKVIGLHWVLGFYPFLFVLGAWALSPAGLVQARRWCAAFLAVHLLVVLALSQTSLTDWSHLRLYHRLVEAARAPELVKQADGPDVVLMSNAYSAASIYGYAAGRHVPVFGPGSVHARQDDLIVDYAQYNGRNIHVLRQSEPDMAEYTPYFDRVTVRTLNVSGAAFHVVEGSGFRYERYRDDVMAEANRRYYHFPQWLPVWGCPFCQRLCGAARCTP